MINKQVFTTATGTAATLNVELGFKPDYVHVLDATNRTELKFQRLDTVNTYGVTVDVNGIKAKAASAAAGIALYSGSVGGDSKGITIGASAVVNAGAAVLTIVAGVYE